MSRRQTSKHRRAFEVWYEFERDFFITLQNLSENDRPRDIRSLYNWSKAYDWTARADERDRKVAELAERESIKRKAEMLKRHATHSRLLQEKGSAYLGEHGIDNAGQAVQAIKIGIELERKAEGLPDWIFELLNATDDQLQAEYARLAAALGGASGDEAPGLTSSKDQAGDL